MYLESYVNKELHTLSSNEPKFQELKLQVLYFCFYCVFFNKTRRNTLNTNLHIRERLHI